MVYGNPKIYNLTLTNAGTEYSQALTANNAYFEVKCRTFTDLQLAFIATNSGTTYITVPAGSTWFSRARFTGVFTIYLQAATAGVVAEILEWT